MRKIITLLITTFWILTACTTISISHARTEENLRQRVQEYWAARLEGNFSKSFEYENMSLDGKVTKQEYAAGIGKIVEEISVKSLSVEGDIAWVTIDGTYNVPQTLGFQNFKTDLKNEFKDKWVFRNNNWYHIKQSFMGGKEW